MKTEVVNPNVSNFIKSLRDVGYTLEVAAADILDNSITAKAKNIKIEFLPEPEMVFGLLDDGDGMTTKQLVEAMRLATKDPDQERDNNDLGRFGLGLKTASFSQCKKLTVITKRNRIVSAKQWDLDYIEVTNEWLLITPEKAEFEDLPLYGELLKQKSGTLVIWQKIDHFHKKDFSETIENLRNHLSLVFHRFLEGGVGVKALKISINNNLLKPFNPFNPSHAATQQLAEEKILINEKTIKIQPYILPHHSKISQTDYEKYGTNEGYTKSQGFYLYRANRLMIYGTWWGLHKSIDAHKLVRIKIDISNDQDKYWGIDIKKSTASPINELKSDLKRVIRQVTEKGSRPFTGRGRKIEDKFTTRFWELAAHNEGIKFILNSKHPIFERLYSDISDESRELLNLYLMGIQAYLPLDAIQAQLQQNPHKIRQEEALGEEEVEKLVETLKSSGLDQEYIDSLLKTEIFKNRKELLINGK
ncbi:ATP-binding protein [Mesobacillus subterraneus]|uniref:ATP-binding protein n=1 Tax=Mesobacillus subterraneus TaxID=285983 RepID=UPI00203C28A8|nr:ATP-binding protein [Mesobacillus subterraneus]